MDQVELTRVLMDHKRWLADPSGAGLARADLTGANLRKADLIKANLSGANLGGADLEGANLSGADLSGADLEEANLIKADLVGANLKGADLRGAKLSWANLVKANLERANLSGADLVEAKLEGANLGKNVVVQSGPLGSSHDYLVTVWHPSWDAEESRTGENLRTLHGLEEIVPSYAPGDNQSIQEYRDAIAYHRAMLHLRGWSTVVLRPC